MKIMSTWTIKGKHRSLIATQDMHAINILAIKRSLIDIGAGNTFSSHKLRSTGLSGVLLIRQVVMNG